MANWRGKAEELLPELEDELAEAKTPMLFWMEVRIAFEKAYERPTNEDLIRRIYQFADWSLELGGRNEDAGKDLPTCARVCFYENLPIFKPARDDMPRWFTRQKVLKLKSVLMYFLTEEEFDKLLVRFSDNPLVSQPEQKRPRPPAKKRKR